MGGFSFFFLLHLLDNSVKKAHFGLISKCTCIIPWLVFIKTNKNVMIDGVRNGSMWQTTTKDIQTRTKATFPTILLVSTAPPSGGHARHSFFFFFFFWDCSAYWVFPPRAYTRHDRLICQGVCQQFGEGQSFAMQNKQTRAIKIKCRTAQRDMAQNNSTSRSFSWWRRILGQIVERFSGKASTYQDRGEPLGE